MASTIARGPTPAPALNVLTDSLLREILEEAKQVKKGLELLTGEKLVNAL